MTRLFRVRPIRIRGAATRLETWESFFEACRSLITPTIYNALRSAKPPDDIRHYRFPASVWRHFEDLPTIAARFAASRGRALPV